MAMGFDPYSPANYAGLPPVDWDQILAAQRGSFAPRGKPKQMASMGQIEAAPATTLPMVMNRIFGERVGPQITETLGLTPVGGMYGLGALGAEKVKSGELPSAEEMQMLAAGAMLPGAPGGKGAKKIRAFHGSPHDFERFSMEKIGTGEGAQAYGHGLYFAEKEDVAKDYRKKLATTAKLPDDVISLPPEMRQAIQAHADTEVDPLTAAKRAQYMNANLRKEPLEKVADMVTRTRDARRGKMYEVEIAADPEHFLDWDKPLSEQPEQVQKIMREQGYQSPQIQTAGSQAIGEKAGRDLRNPEEVARLRQAGIPGIRYLDQGSRGAIDPEPHLEQTPSGRWRISETLTRNYRDLGGLFETKDEALAAIKERIPQVTSNYVVFDENLINILRKYGIAGLLGLSAIPGMDGQPAQAQSR